LLPRAGRHPFRGAVRAGRTGRADRLHAQSVRYISEKDGVQIVLEVALFWPRAEIKDFAEVGPAQMGNIRLSPRGAPIELEGADVDIDVGSLVSDLIPAKEMAAALARHGRQTTSAEQAEAARRNGAKGGRPRKHAL
jgi:hypothetical protein